MNAANREARSRRADAGRALHEKVTAAITTAFFEELAEVGYGRMSVDSAVRRAGVGKAAVYRRWPSKDAMAFALISEVAVGGAPMPNTGSLHGDLVAFMTGLRRAMRHPLAGRIIPAVAAEAGRDPELRRVLRRTVEAPRRAGAARMLQRAVARSELPADCDIELALDLMIAPLYWRLLVRRRDLDAAGIKRLSDGLVAAMSATTLAT